MFAGRGARAYVAAMTESLPQALESLAADFEMLESWEAKLEYVLELGAALPELPEAERNEINKVRGCASQVWLQTQTGADGRVWFRADSDAQIPRGLIAILLQLYSGRTREEIAAVDPAAAIERLELQSLLTLQRANGLSAMADRIRRAALAPSRAGA